ncbi:MAG: bifunctional aldolase/short-chain dehydrogenase [Planctomycetota bacterium]|jgi:rhamnulose-1-phosphate aldolase/alcohol dehydrogenase
MKSRWTDRGAREAVDRWGGQCGEALALRLFTARMLGAEPTLVLHGGGNVSVKEVRPTLLGDQREALLVKGSGRDLATLEPGDLAGLDLPYLRRLRALDALTDAQMVNELRTHLLDASAPTPSIETLVHAFLPHPYVDHSHADALLALTNQPDGAALAQEALGDRVAVVPYVRPGFDLARAVADCGDDHPDLEGIVLLFHGLITFGDDARTAYERHVALVDACERFVAKRARGRALTRVFRADETPTALAARAAPLLRGLLACPTGNEDRPYRRPLLEWRAGDAILALVDSKQAQELVATGPLTTDHLIHTKPSPLFVASPHYQAEEDGLRRQLEEAVAAYRRRYAEYVTRHGGSAQDVDASPRVVLLPGAGLFGWGPTKRAARITADLAEHTLAVQVQANALGRYASLPDDHLYDMEYRAIQRAKLDETERALAGQVVVISGGAGAIGAAVAQVCAEHGAHVAVTDLDEERIAPVVARVEERCGPGTALGLVMDVTDQGSVREGYAAIVRHFGGVDVVVPNAGIAHVAAIEDLAVEDFRRVMEVNAVGYLLFMREGIRILRQQGLGGHVVINASKNVFGPGKDFGAYSASKAAGHQLGKVAALELAPHGIRVNMINADAIFGDEEVPSHLWATVGPERARSRKMELEDLPEYYRGRNLLKARVYGHHVGNAVVFFASNATPTTGATLPVDGGVPDAFPR